jgi:hypothetical protein
MKKIIYINHGLAKKCGVYDLGVRHFNSIKNIKEYNILYYEIDSIDGYFKMCSKEKPDGIFFNHMRATSSWINENINLYKCVKYCVPHLFYKDNFYYENEDPYQNIYDYFIILDKNSKEDFKNFKTNRPLLKFNPVEYKKNSIPTIGAFGFAFLEKRLSYIAKEVNKNFDRAILNFNIPMAHFAPNIDVQTDIINPCISEITKPDIVINFQTEFLSQEELIKKLNSNDLNCLFYPKENIHGVSSSLDYAVSAQKPILITDSLMYRSFIDELPKYPETSILDIFNNYEYYQNNIYDIYHNSINEIEEQTKLILDRTL